MIVHLNGQLLPAEHARVSPFDRGFVFGDGVYEGLRTVTTPPAKPRVIGLGMHIHRMQRGLDEAGIVWDAASIGPATTDLLEANGFGADSGREAFVYWQVTRGTPPEGEPVRSRVPPRASTMRPTVFGYCSPQPPLESITEPPTKRAALVRDIRWERGHLKSISLMGNIMLALRADAAGSDEAVMIRSRNGIDLVTEGLATNVVIALPNSAGGPELATPSLDGVPILAGVTRAILLAAAPDIRERNIAADELTRASEIMLVGTTTLVTAVTHLDGRAIGGGTAGPAAKRLFRLLVDTIRHGRDDG